MKKMNIMKLLKNNNFKSKKVFKKRKYTIYSI